MTRSSHRGPVALFAMVALVLGGASLAWACSAQARMWISPEAGAAGDEVAVRGIDFVPGQPVTVRWNSPTGPLLATAMGPNFTAKITIPDTAPGVYYVLATSGPYQKSASFEVLAADATGAGGGTSQSGPGQTSTTVSGGSNRTNGAPQNAGGDTSGKRQTTDSGEPTADLSGADSESASDARTSATVSGAAARSARAPSGPDTTGSATRKVTGEGSTGAPNLASNVPASSRPSKVTTATGTFFGGSFDGTARAQAPGTRPSDGVALPAARTSDGIPSNAAASSDLWSGFSSKTTAALIPSLAKAGSTANNGTRLVLGVGLLGTGLVALLAAFAIAQVRRRRARASVLNG